MNKKGAFTLAEVLITLGIIGVVATMTIPSLITNHQQRSMDTTANVFNRRLGEALKIMNSQSSLAGHNSTKNFVSELSRHIKIIKICDNSELGNCFASEFSTTDTTYKVDDLKLSSNLNQNANYGTETVGVVFGDGVTALIAYNPNANQDPFSNQIVGVTSGGAGSGKSIGLSTNALAILYDVTGTANPNMFGADASGKLKDIRGLNVSIKIGSDFVILDENYSYVDCRASNSDSPDFKYCTYIGVATDYSAGAKKACDDIGMKLPNFSEAVSLTQNPNVGLDLSKWLYTTDSLHELLDPEGVDYWAVVLIPDMPDYQYNAHRDGQYSVVCIAN